MTTTNPRLSKTLGALLGVHTGDSLGATLEFRSWNSIKAEYPKGLREIIGGGVFQWPAGHATDDTDLTRAVLLAYQDRHNEEKGGKSETEVDVVRRAADYSLNWFEGEWPGRKKGSSPIDVGNATGIGLSNYAHLKDPSKCGAGNGSAGNGSLMRCIPTALFVASREARVKESMGISAFTHNDARCTVACAAYNEIVAALIEGESVEKALQKGFEAAEELECPTVVKAIERGKEMKMEKFANEGPGTESSNYTSGYVLHSLTVAISALLDSRSFEDVLVDVVRLGGDTDTNGAISGGLLGARDGVEAIPERWLKVLQFRGEFEEITRTLLNT